MKTHMRLPLQPIAIPSANCRLAGVMVLLALTSASALAGPGGLS